MNNEEMSFLYYLLWLVVVSVFGILPTARNFFLVLYHGFNVAEKYSFTEKLQVIVFLWSTFTLISVTIFFLSIL